MVTGCHTLSGGSLKPCLVSQLSPLSPSSPAHTHCMGCSSAPSPPPLSPQHSLHGLQLSTLTTSPQPHDWRPLPRADVIARPVSRVARFRPALTGDACDLGQAIWPQSETRSTTHCCSSGLTRHHTPNCYIQFHYYTGEYSYALLSPDCITPAGNSVPHNCQFLHGNRNSNRDIFNMCFKTDCATCKKPTWSGCGENLHAMPRSRPSRSLHLL